MHDRETNTERLLRLRFAPNWPATAEQADMAGRFWPEGLTHRGKSPKTLREKLEEVFG